MFYVASIYRLAEMFRFDLTLVRHGETELNRLKVLQGQSDYPLSSVGLKQAELAGARLQLEPYTHIFSSDLSRAQQTANEILRQNLFFKGTLQLNKNLRERNFSIFEGKSYNHLKEGAKKAGQSIYDFCPPGGETTAQVYQRAVEFFDYLCKLCADSIAQARSKDNDTKESISNHEDESGSTDNESSPTVDSKEERSKHSLAPNVLIVSHGVFLLQLMRYVVKELNCPIPDGIHALGLTPNTGISKFTVSYTAKSKGKPAVICHQIHDDSHVKL